MPRYCLPRIKSYVFRSWVSMCVRGQSRVLPEEIDTSPSRYLMRVITSVSWMLDFYIYTKCHRETVSLPLLAHQLRSLKCFPSFLSIECCCFVERRGNNSLGLLKRLSLWSQSKSHTLEEPGLCLSLLKRHGVEYVLDCCGEPLRKQMEN